MLRRRFLWSGIGATAAAAAAYPFAVEPRWLEMTETPVRLSRLKPGKPVRILHLSDLHASWVVPMSYLARAFELGLTTKPDLICLTGDFITFQLERDEATYLEQLRRFPAAAPTFAVLGNHDGGSVAGVSAGVARHAKVYDLLEKAGIHVLYNHRVPLNVNDREFQLAGTADLWSREFNVQSAFAGTNPGLATILLAHNPDTKDVSSVEPWDLLLSGHTHGGQVVTPFKSLIYAPVQDLRYIAGLKAWGKRQVFVTRGVGNVGGIRFGCRPEVSLLTLL
jgi:predicted MPP superfamily phosphohydrolase